MHPVEPPARNAIADRAVGEAEIAELTARHDAMLSRRKRRDLPIDGGWASFCRNSRQKLAHTPRCCGTRRHRRERWQRKRHAWGAQRTNSPPTPLQDAQRRKRRVARHDRTALVARLEQVLHGVARDAEPL